MRHSAALLVKRSAAQLAYYASKNGFESTFPERTPVTTAAQIAGDASAAKQSKSQFVEMSGVFNKLNIQTQKQMEIFHSIDELELISKRVYVIEHKHIESEATKADWFFQASLIQTAFMGALVQFGERYYRTARYHPGEKHQVKLPIDGRVITRLCMEGTYYAVTFDPVKVMKFYLTKARAVEQKHEVAKRFDEAYKQKEWDSYFKDVISYRKWDRESLFRTLGMD